MDIDVQKRLDQAIERLRTISPDEVDAIAMDPVARMMLVALEGEVQKMTDDVGRVEQRLLDRFCSDFIPRHLTEATPSMVLVELKTKSDKDTSLIPITSNALFSPKKKTTRQGINYIPLLASNVIPYQRLYVVTPQQLRYNGQRVSIQMTKPNRVYIGIQTEAETDSLHGISLLLKGTGGIVPTSIRVGSDASELAFHSVSELECIEMLEPFDAQQASRQTFSFYETWKNELLNLPDELLLFITDPKKDRDLFKPRTYPKIFGQWMEDETLNSFEANTIWIRLDFPEGFIVPDTVSVVPNVVPIVNVDVCNTMLTSSVPIAKLQKSDDSYFLGVLETTTSGQKQGYDKREADVLIRDFGASCYHDGDLYRDVRYLYNKFIDDYYAFTDYNNIKDGDLLKRLRQAINDLSQSVTDKKSGRPKSERFKYDSGTYAMKNLNSLTSTAKVTYITTQGALGNSIESGDVIENKRTPGIAREVKALTAGMCGTDKADADSRYELLRYYSLTNDRLFTKMDIEAFIRKELVLTFGREEFERILVKSSIAGTGGIAGLRRGLYIDLMFKDKKNYNMAMTTAFHLRTKQKIANKSCISMPIIITLKCLDE